ncbi:hypothetical protein NLN94_09200 [Citrobacter portucalensis]|nr:hypothetical protein [Citrobacter portucalensis]MCX9061107.1 hypothetical protein [Citrobacter portucalensis]
MPYQENLLTLCPEELPRLQGEKGHDLAAVLLRYQDIYPVCAARHNSLVNEILLRRKAKNE